LIKNSQPFVKNVRKPQVARGWYFWLTLYIHRISLQLVMQRVSDGW